MNIIKNFFSSVIRYLVLIGLMKSVKKLNYDNCVLTFSDEFNSRRLDTNKWMTHYYWGNSHAEDEQQFYSNDAFHLEKSCLTINVENKNNTGWIIKDGKREKRKFNVTSGLIHTGEYFKQRFGRFEICCKVPLTEGYIPAFWLIDPNSYPPEIDVMGFSEEDNSKLAVGYAFGDDEVAEMFFRVKKIFKKIKLNEFNTYTLDWTPTRLTWYVNGYVVYQAENIGIPQCPMYVAINMAITNIDAKLSKTKKMQIDWVRVYKFSY